MLAQRIADEAVIVLTTSTPTPTSAEQTRLMVLVAKDVLAAIHRPAAIDTVVARCRSIAAVSGTAVAGDIVDAVCHATAVVHEGCDDFAAVLRAVASISDTLDAELRAEPDYALAV